MGGFEPPTAWFVARYSIQLSYGRIKLEKGLYRKPVLCHGSNNKKDLAEREGFEPSMGF